MSGTLYLCATPIGNLGDITLRVIELLKECDLIAAEDTRNTIKLLNHFGIKTPLISYHEHNKISKGPILIEKLKSGMNIALVTDAGMPGISDPGADLVKLCFEEGIRATAAPGASAAVRIQDVLFLKVFCRPTGKNGQKRLNPLLKRNARLYFMKPRTVLRKLSENLLKPRATGMRRASGK